MINGFKDQDTQDFFNGVDISRFRSFKSAAMRKLDMLDAATCLVDLKVPLSDKLEPLCGKKAGTYSIHINRQWRLCSVWNDNGPVEVENVVHRHLGDRDANPHSSR